MRKTLTRGRAAGVLCGSSVLALSLLSAAAFAQQAPEAPAKAQSEEQQKPQAFDVFEYRVLGNTMLARDAIERAVYPYLGSGKNLDVVEHARADLEQAYHAAGFGTVFVDIPEQTVEDGVVRLHVTEGKLRRVAIEGAKYFSAREIRSAIPSAAAGTTPDLKALQSQLGALNAQTTDRQITPVLGAGPLPGTVDLTLKVHDELPLHGSVEVNDRYTADTEKLRATVALSYNNLFDRLDNLSLQYQTAPQEPNQLAVFAGSYTARLNDRGDNISFLYVNSDSNVAALGTLSVLGKGQIFSSRVQMPFINTARSSQTFSYGVEYKDFSESIQLDEASQFNTPISYFNLSVGHTSLWRMDAGNQLFWTSSANFGPRGAGNSDQEFADKRYRGRPNYFYLRSEASARVMLPFDASLRLSAAGQYAVDPIIANEQFSIGGADGVRGYLEAEELGDIGFRSSLELGTPSLNLFAKNLTLDGFVFYDIGRVSTIDPLPGEASNSALRSWGAGFNLFGFDHVSGTLQWAKPLLDATRTKAGESRVHFVIRSSW
ncbi:MAG: ShlB/FhaC/HecB family hemolysin secretion/activation protein [Gammaproteobacteria bacterium]